MARLVRFRAVGGLFHGGDAGADFLAGTIGDIEENLGGVSDTLDGSDHLIDGSGGFRNAGSLNLSVLNDVLHVDAHFVHGAGDFFNSGRGLHADLGGFIGCTSHLIGAGGNLGSAITSRANNFLEAVRHAGRTRCRGCHAWNGA